AGAGMGTIGSWWSRRAAEAAVEVRPSLANVGWWDAFLANHLTDWLYFQFPTAMTAFTVAFTTFVFLVTAWLVING
ncbi:hypothetical protein, partial [Halorubrum sp. SP3]